MLFTSILLLVRRRRGETYTRRRRAGERGGCLFVGALLSIAAGGVLAIGWLLFGIIFAEQINPPIERGADDLFGVEIPIGTLDALTWIALTPTVPFTGTPSITPTLIASATLTPSMAPTTTRRPPTPSSPPDAPELTPTPIPLITNTPIASATSTHRPTATPRTASQIAS